MQVIPVIDLKQGAVVHAVRGLRQFYQPIHTVSKICADSSPFAVINAFLALHPFRTLYIADLDAIAGTGNQQPLIAQLMAAFPQVEFWLDQAACLRQLPVMPTANYKTVLATETQQNSPQPIIQNYILSLDYLQEQALGHPDWFSHSHYWPKQVLLMTLSRVGANAGPDWTRLQALTQAHPGKQIIAAGGVRDVEDLLRLKTLGAYGVLVATCLHVGAVSAEDLRKLSGN